MRLPSADGCLALGATGPILRSTGLPHDLRKAEPYCGYETYDFDVITRRDHDAYARTVIRLEETAPEYGAERRRLRVIKYRGQRFRGGYHDYLIKGGGLEVFPRLIAAEHERARGHPGRCRVPAVSAAARLWAAGPRPWP